MKKSMKTKLAMFAVAGAMAVSGTVGIAAPAKAGNTTNDEFKYNSNSPAGISRWRDKENATKVYIYPTTGPVVDYRVQGEAGVTGTANYRSAYVTIPRGVEASVTNYVYENDENYARLRMTRRSTVTGKITSGWWSPDSTKVYTVYPK